MRKQENIADEKYTSMNGETKDSRAGECNDETLVVRQNNCLSAVNTFRCDYVCLCVYVIYFIIGHTSF